MTNIDLVHSFFLHFFGAEKGQSIRVTLHSKDTKTTWVTYWTSRAMAHCILAEEDQEGEWKRQTKHHFSWDIMGKSSINASISNSQHHPVVGGLQTFFFHPQDKNPTTLKRGLTPPTYHPTSPTTADSRH